MENTYLASNELMHHGTKGMHWGIRKSSETSGRSKGAKTKKVKIPNKKHTEQIFKGQRMSEAIYVDNVRSNLVRMDSNGKALHLKEDLTKVISYGNAYHREVSKNTKLESIKHEKALKSKDKLKIWTTEMNVRLGKAYDADNTKFLKDNFDAYNDLTDQNLSYEEYRKL